MKTPHLIIAVALVIALISLVGAGPASAASISFIEVSEGTSILLLTSGLGSSTASRGSESASVTVGTATGTSVPLLSIGLTGQGSTQISDLISARAFISGSTLTGAFQISFDSDTEGPLNGSAGSRNNLDP